MARDLESLRNTLWTQFEKVAADSALGWGEDFQKANALGALAGPLVAIETYLDNQKAEQKSASRSP
jgi:hypothetical protein